ncbi:hypothetical protein M433DRAFT_159410 [Acidomyces richmondensis BFW]|nr:hypothetical protein M433DRAFT_159410 [Acidomyces richmondensis BFW]
MGSHNLESLVRQHRERTRQGPWYDYMILDIDEKNIITLVLHTHDLNETDKDVEWAIIAVIKCSDLMKVILKRFDRVEYKGLKPHFCVSLNNLLNLPADTTEGDNAETRRRYSDPRSGCLYTIKEEPEY